MATLKRQITALFANHFKTTIFIYGILIALFITALKYFEFQYINKDLSVEIYVSAVALLFTVFGLWIGLKLISNRKEDQINAKFHLNQNGLKELRITTRELEVLQLMAKGLSNQEIGDRLFISLPTVKSHASNLFEKLSSQRRTQAIIQAKKHQLIP